MASPKRDDGAQRQAFKQHSLRTILSYGTDKKGNLIHPLRALVDPKTRRWYPNGIRRPGPPSVDAGHTVSDWTGNETHYVLEDSDRNRYYNHAEGGPKRGGVWFHKQAVLIGQVSMDLATAQDLERAGLLPAGTVARAPRIAGARVVRSASNTYTVEVDLAIKGAARTASVIAADVALGLLVDLLMSAVKEKIDRSILEDRLRQLQPELERKKSKVAENAHLTVKDYLDRKLYYNIAIRVTTRSTIFVAGRSSNTLPGSPEPSIESVSLSDKMIESAGAVTETAKMPSDVHPVMEHVRSQIVIYSEPLTP